MTSLLFLMNLSISTGCFPTAWKIARITALYKSGCRKSCQNYRLISVLPLLSKIIEKHIFKSFLHYLQNHKLLSDLQFGFRERHSTIDALLAIKQTIINALNRKKKCLIVCLDLKKAFDLVSHELLYLKLYKYGCDERSLKWFKSYLENRYQFVKTENSVSSIENIGSVSVIQGSILGPLLFSIYINDIFKIGINGFLALFADDMTLVVEGETYEDLEHKTNQNLCLINKWLKKNRLILNLDKSHFVVMGRPRSHLNINISIGSKSLSRVNDSKILGVSVDHDLRFESHIQNLRKKSLIV